MVSYTSSNIRANTNRASMQSNERTLTTRGASTCQGFVVGIARGSDDVVAGFANLLYVNCLVSLGGVSQADSHKQSVEARSGSSVSMIGITK